jgi:hypothetical protein
MRRAADDACLGFAPGIRRVARPARTLSNVALAVCRVDNPKMLLSNARFVEQCVSGLDSALP